MQEEKHTRKERDGQPTPEDQRLPRPDQEEIDLMNEVKELSVKVGEACGEAGEG